LRVVDGEETIAEINPPDNPFGDLTVRPAVGSLRDVKLSPGRPIDVDVVALLREDRDKR
jgi:hypothetical protein